VTKEKFSYQNLRVYEDMIRAISLGEEVASGWDSVHAIADHFARASEGALLCLAESSRKRQIPARMEVATAWDRFWSVLPALIYLQYAEASGRMRQINLFGCLWKSIR